MPWWEIAVAVAAAVACVLIGMSLPTRRPRRDGDEVRRSLHEARTRARRATAYLGVACGWHTYLDTLRPLVFPDQSLLGAPRDLTAVLRSRAELQLSGSASVQQLHEDALEEAVVLIGLLRRSSDEVSTNDVALGETRHLLRLAMGELSRRVGILERQMNWELNPRAIEEGVELTGRAAIARDVAAHIPT